MSLNTVLAFSALAALLVVIPGPAVILVLKSAMLRGRRSALLTASGVLASDLIWASASILGVTALLVSSQIAFDIVRIIGALYLVYLGIKLMLTKRFDPTAGAEEVPKRATRGRAFREGFLSELANPKTVLVYASVIPQFLSASSTPSSAFILGLVFAALGFLSLLGYALMFGAAGAFLRNQRVIRNILRGGGGILVFFGAGLLVQRPAH